MLTWLRLKYVGYIAGIHNIIQTFWTLYKRQACFYIHDIYISRVYLSVQIDSDIIILFHTNKCPLLLANKCIPYHIVTIDYDYSIKL